MLHGLLWISKVASRSARLTSSFAGPARCGPPSPQLLSSSAPGIQAGHSAAWATAATPGGEVPMES